jgi:hypothetical protein
MGTNGLVMLHSCVSQFVYSDLLFTFLLPRVRVKRKSLEQRFLNCVRASLGGGLVLGGGAICLYEGHTYLT